MMSDFGHNFSYFAKLRHSRHANEIRNRLLDELKKIANDTSCIRDEYLCIFNDILLHEPCLYWDKSVFQHTYNCLTNLSLLHSIEINEDIFNFYYIAYSAYRQISDIINDLDDINDSPVIKNRMYRLPTYVSIIEGCLSNLFRFLLHIVEQTTQKQYSNINKLSPMCEALQKNGFGEIVNNVDINIRNAINHGGVVFKEEGKTIDFMYSKNHQPVVESFKAYDFDRKIQATYDTASAAILACTLLLNNSDIVNITNNNISFVSLEYLGMKLSLPFLRCININVLPDYKQMNIIFYSENTDKTYLYESAFEIAMIVYNIHSNFEKYWIGFHNERLLPCWIRFNNSEINDVISRSREIGDVLMDIICNRKDTMMWEASEEDIDLNELKYFRFPNFTCNSFRIRQVEDISLEDRKRLRAHLYIGTNTDRNEILKIILEAIDWIKKLKNPPQAATIIKHGDMEAESIYMKVYRQDTRGNKELFIKNENFVCIVDYNLSGETTLKTGGVPENLWNMYTHEKFGKLQIAWREKKYVPKIGRNELCPCGSEKKYKKCCGQFM